MQSHLSSGASCQLQAQVQFGHLGVIQLCPLWANCVHLAAKIMLTQPELQTLFMDTLAWDGCSSEQLCCY